MLSFIFHILLSWLNTCFNAWAVVSLYVQEPANFMCVFLKLTTRRLKKKYALFIAIREAILSNSTNIRQAILHFILQLKLLDCHFWVHICNQLDLITNMELILLHWHPLCFYLILLCLSLGSALSPLLFSSTNWSNSKLRLIKCMNKVQNAQTS